MINKNYYFKTPKSKQELNALLHVYELYKDVVCCYLNNPTNPSNKELNIFYMRELVPSILKLIENLKLDYLIKKKYVNLTPNFILFTSLFVSEKILQDEDKDPKQVRVELFNTYGQIKELVEKAGAVMQDSIPEIEEVINKGKDLISESRIIRSEEKEEGVLYKNKKRIHLPKYPRTEWIKVSIKFIEERSLLLSDSKEVKPCVPESFGCLDERTQKPDDSWEFLVKIAKGEGRIVIPLKKEREKQKKQKQKITDILRKIFKNDTDPFEAEKGGIYVAKFKISYTEEESRIILKEELKFLDLKEAFYEMTEPTQEEKEHDFFKNIKPGKDGEYSQ